MAILTRFKIELTSAYRARRRGKQTECMGKAHNSMMRSGIIYLGRDRVATEEWPCQLTKGKRVRLSTGLCPNLLRAACRARRQRKQIDYSGDAYDNMMRSAIMHQGRNQEEGNTRRRMAMPDDR